MNSNLFQNGTNNFTINLIPQVTDTYLPPIKQYWCYMCKKSFCHIEENSDIQCPFCNKTFCEILTNEDTSDPSHPKNFEPFILHNNPTNSNTSVGIMGETFKNCAALAGALDYSIEDVAVAVGLMANAGIKGSNAGTALKNVFNGLLSGVTLTSEAFGEVEYSAINADGTMKSFGETINDLRGYFDQMTGAEKLQNAEALAGQRAMAGFVSIMNSTDDDFKSLTENIKKCDGAASKMAKIKLDNLKGDITLMNSASDALKTTRTCTAGGPLQLARASLHLAPWCMFNDAVGALS